MSTPQRICRQRSLRRGGGITEVVVSTLLVGTMIVAALQSVGAVFRTRRFNADRLTGPGLAQELMTEVLSMPYDDPENPGAAIGVNLAEAAVSRTAFDDVDDYHNWSAADAKDKTGASRSGYTGWSELITVAWADRTNGTSGAAYDTGLKRITVTVTSPAGGVTQLVALRYKQGILEQSRPLAATAATWIGAELRSGASARSQFTAATLDNHCVDAN